MKHIILFLFLFSINNSFAKNQPDSLTVDFCKDAFIEQLRIYPQEKIFVHTDRSSYVAGDTVWFKIYLTDAVVHFPSKNSRFAYVELISPLGNIVKRLKVKLGTENSYGEFEIPSSQPQGNYYIRAYTGMMYGLPHGYFFNKSIYIAASTFSGIKENLYYNFDNDKITVSLYFTDLNSGENLPIKEVQIGINENVPKQLKMKDGSGQFSFKISEESLARIMHLQFNYENQMFNKYINIPYPEEDFKVSFFPEGGYLVAGANCRIGMKALKSNGLSEEVQGYISDNEGNVINNDIHTIFKGMGSFEFKPQAGKFYYATLTNLKGNTEIFPLPDVSSDAFSISAKWDNERFSISINGLKEQHRTEFLYLLIHSRGVTYYVDKWDNEKNFLLFSKQDFPSGIIQILLLDSSYQPISERMLFCYNEDQAHIKLTTDRQSCEWYDNIQLYISLNDITGKPLKGNFSMSVTNDKYTNFDENSNILSYLLLDSDLKGYIEEPGFYFKHDEPLASLALDNLMLTQGWKRYNIPEILKGNFQTLYGFIELGQEISGTVNNLSGKKRKRNAQVRMISLDNMFADETTTDVNGHFSFEGIDFKNNTEFILQAYDDKGSNQVSLVVNEDEYPNISSSDLFPISEKKIIDKTIRPDNMRMINLDEVEITASKVEKDISSYSKLADVSFDSKKIKELNAVCVHELLRRIAGLQVIGDRVVIRGASSIYGHSYAAIAIDGIIVSAMDESRENSSLEFDLDIINMADIERVDIFKGGSAVIWGPAGGKGVISFTTKRRDFDYSNIDQLKYNTKKIKPLGYITPCEFYVPEYILQNEYNFNSTTVFWAPNINSNDDGDAVVDFSIPDKDAVYSISLQGITNEGLIINPYYKLKK